MCFDEPRSLKSADRTLFWEINSAGKIPTHVSIDSKYGVDELSVNGVVSDFNQPIDEGAWPPSLLKVAPGECFDDQPVAGVAWPASLGELASSPDFSLPNESFEWPASLEKLTTTRRPDEQLPKWPRVRVSRIWRSFWEA